MQRIDYRLCPFVAAIAGCDEGFVLVSHGLVRAVCIEIGRTAPVPDLPLNLLRQEISRQARNDTVCWGWQDSCKLLLSYVSPRPPTFAHALVQSPMQKSDRHT